MVGTCQYPDSHITKVVPLSFMFLGLRPWDNWWIEWQNTNKQKYTQENVIWHSRSSCSCHRIKSTKGTQIVPGPVSYPRVFYVQVRSLYTRKSIFGWSNRSSVQQKRSSRTSIIYRSIYTRNPKKTIFVVFDYRIYCSIFHQLSPFTLNLSSSMSSGVPMDLGLWICRMGKGERQTGRE